jgi:hypothetical protein
MVHEDFHTRFGIRIVGGFEFDGGNPYFMEEVSDETFQMRQT